MKGLEANLSAGELDGMMSEVEVIRRWLTCAQVTTYPDPLDVEKTIVKFDCINGWTIKFELCPNADGTHKLFQL